MFVCNLKVNKKLIVKIGFVFLFLLAIILTFFAIYQVFSPSQKVNDSIPNSGVISIDSNNYTNILKTVHEDLSSYLGKQISFTGYIYRVYDLKENEFILARDMMIGESESQSLVVGFLCEYPNSSKFTDGTWVSITGEIQKGDYHGDIPILHITNISPCEKPENPFVLPPDDTYIPTSALF